MSLNCGSEGAFSAIAIDAVGATFDDESERYEFLAENVGLQEKVVRGVGITGELDDIGSHLRPGSGYVAGQVLMNVTPKEFDLWAPRILGGGAKDVSNVFPIGTTFPAFDMLIKRDNFTKKYTECVVAAAMFSSEVKVNDDGDEEPSLLKMLLSIIGKDEETATWPDPEPPINTIDKLYWIQADSTLTLMGTAYPYDSFQLAINNMMRPKLRNSLRPVCIESVGRMVTLNASIPASATAVTNLYNTRPDGAASLSFLGTKYLGVSSEYVTTFTFAKLYGEKVTPATRGRTEIPLPVKLRAYKDGANGPVTITNDFPAEV